MVSSSVTAGEILSDLARIVHEHDIVIHGRAAPERELAAREPVRPAAVLVPGDAALPRYERRVAEHEALDEPLEEKRGRDLASPLDDHRSDPLRRNVLDPEAQIDPVRPARQRHDLGAGRFELAFA